MGKVTLPPALNYYDSGPPEAVKLGVSARIPASTGPWHILGQVLIPQDLFEAYSLSLALLAIPDMHLTREKRSQS